jgi:hypothetical protein
MFLGLYISSMISRNKSIPISDKIHTCSPYFDFDEMDYFYTKISEEELTNLENTESQTEKERLFFDMVFGRKLSMMADTVIIPQLETIGFQSEKLNKDIFIKIKEIFCERKSIETTALACERIYRDILVFKKNGEIVGTAKICFSCEDHIITGTNANTESFGEKGDYWKLRRLLNK